MRPMEYPAAGRAPGGGTDDGGEHSGELSGEHGGGHGGDSGRTLSHPSLADGTAAAEKGAGGVVFDRDGNVLILRHASGHWVFPKGHVENGETELDAALREVREESGVRAECLSDTSWHTTYVNPRGSRRLITWYACEAIDTRLRLEEALFAEGGFFPTERALELLSHGADRELLAGVLAWRASEAARATGDPSEASSAAGSGR